MRYISYLIILFTSNLTFASQEQTFNDNVTWAKNISTPQTQINVEDYCADNDSSCKQKVHSPDQVGMTDAQIDSKKMTEFVTDPQANALQDNFDNGRPVIDPNDETYRMALIGQDNAYEITHGISTAYADCDSGMSCTSEKYLQHCSKPTNNPVNCEKNPYVIERNPITGQSSIGGPGQFIGFNEPIRFNVPSGINRITKLILPDMFYWTPSTAIFSVNIYLNGVFVARRSVVPFYSGMFASSRLSSQTIVIDAVIPSNGTITLTAGSEAYYLWTDNRVTIEWQKDENIMGWRSTCTGILPECKKTNEVCIEPGGTRLINNIETTLPCWKYRLTYLCETTDTCILNEPILSQACKTQVMGICIEYDVIQELENKICKEDSLICGEASFCLDGDCYDETPTQSQDFSKSVSMLAAVSEAAEDIGDPPLIFTGQNMRCSIKAGGLANCCKDGGWGTDINITSCDSEEEALNEAQSELLTIPLGSYCAEKVLGVCIRKKRSYCVFDSKLARIIQQQGKPQIGKNFGTAKNPNCSAITPEEMQQMDFSQMDFSDFYGDMQDNVNIPNNDEIKARMASAYGS